MLFSLELKPLTWFTIGTLLEKSIKFDTVLTAEMHLGLFEFTSPLLKYFQTNGIMLFEHVTTEVLTK
jgi:hypothetical protein